MLGSFKGDLTQIAIHCFLEGKALVICETNVYQVSDEFVDLRLSLARAWHEPSRILRQQLSKFARRLFYMNTAGFKIVDQINQGPFFNL